MGAVLWFRTGEELSILRGEALILLPDALLCVALVVKSSVMLWHLVCNIDASQTNPGCAPKA
jgi:hypothetical protein